MEVREIWGVKGEKWREKEEKVEWGEMRVKERGKKAEGVL